MKVLSFKLVTGEELVSELSRTIEEAGKVVAYELRRPHVLQFQQLPNGHLGLAFVPWSLSNPELPLITIPASAIITQFETSAKVEAQYLQQTSSIQIASSI